LTNVLLRQRSKWREILHIGLPHLALQIDTAICRIGLRTRAAVTTFAWNRAIPHFVHELEN
jgi:hypothetical protein